MTRNPNFPELAVLTIKDPAAAAQVILGWQIPREALWTSIALVSVIITMLSTLSNILFPVPGPLSSIVGNPFIYLVVAVAGFFGTVYAVFWTGRMLGGQGDVDDMMRLMLWLQALRAAAQVLVLIVLVLAPVVASFLVLLIAAVTLWIFVHFVNAALRLDSILKSVLVLFLAALLLIAALSFLMSVLGISAVGVPMNV